MLFSDGRARDENHVAEVAERFASLGVPIHVVPIGDTSKGGDISIVSVVAPPSVRKQSQVTVNVFLRSYGFDGERTEVRLNAVDRNGEFTRKLSSIPVTLKSGFQSVGLAFRTDLETRRLQVSIPVQPLEISTGNNKFLTEISVDRTKIRVLYLEGSASSSVSEVVDNRVVQRGPHSDLQNALQDDPDIECVVLSTNGDNVRVVSGSISAFPRSLAELASFDAVIFSDVASDLLDETKMEWLESCVGLRGCGLCMVGGRNSFASGGWDRTLMKRLLPVQFRDPSGWHSGVRATVRADTSGEPHPLLRILDDDTMNREVLAGFPAFRGANLHLLPKPSLTAVLP